MAEKYVTVVLTMGNMANVKLIAKVMVLVVETV
jgi:hypothetical protein